MYTDCIARARSLALSRSPTSSHLVHGLHLAAVQGLYNARITEEPVDRPYLRREEKAEAEEEQESSL